MKTRGTATDKLADVIQALELVHKTGYLFVQDDTPGNVAEEGMIIFHDGQVIDASVGRLRGADAFKKLVAWTTCHFVFENTPEVPTVLPSSHTTLPIRAPRYEYDITSLVPYRAPQSRGFLPAFHHSGLSRIHQRVFMLIDGKRSIQEVMRLTGRPPQEILVLLADLEDAGLIRQNGADPRSL